MSKPVLRLTPEKKTTGNYDGAEHINRYRKLCSSFIKTRQISAEKSQAATEEHPPSPKNKKKQKQQNS